MLGSDQGCCAPDAQWLLSSAGILHSWTEKYSVQIIPQWNSLSRHWVSSCPALYPRVGSDVVACVCFVAGVSVVARQGPGLNIGSVGISSSQLSPAAEVLFPRPAHRCGQSADPVVAGPLGPHTRPSPDPKSRRPGDRGELQQSTSPRPRPKTQPPHSPTHPLTLFSALQGEILRQQLHPQPTRIAQPPVPLPPPSSIVSWPLFPCSRSLSLIHI